MGISSITMSIVIFKTWPSNAQPLSSISVSCNGVQLSCRLASATLRAVWQAGAFITNNEHSVRTGHGAFRLRPDTFHSHTQMKGLGCRECGCVHCTQHPVKSCLACMRCVNAKDWLLAILAEAVVVSTERMSEG